MFLASIDVRQSCFACTFCEIHFTFFVGNSLLSKFRHFFVYNSFGWNLDCVKDLSFSMSGSTNTYLIKPCIQLSFSSKSSRHLHFQTVWARDLTFLENVHLSPSVTCQMSIVTCHMSHVKCHMSGVRCHMSFFTGGAYCLRVCYQRSLPRQVL